MKTGTLMAVPFDAERLELRGAPVAMLDNVMQAIAAYNFDDETGAGQFTVSTNGTLAYVTGGIYPVRQAELVWVDRKGLATSLPIPTGGYLVPRVSPDGKRLAYFAQRGRSRNGDIWVYDIERQNSTRLTFQGQNTWPLWAPDGKSLVFSTQVSGILNLEREPRRPDCAGHMWRPTLPCAVPFEDLEFNQLAYTTGSRTISSLKMESDSCRSPMCKTRDV
jgi:hypothetical protein